LAGLLAHLTFCGLPVPNGAVAEFAKNYSEVYSCGHSSGIAPDSLFLIHFRNRKLVNQVGTKVEKINRKQLK